MLCKARTRASNAEKGKHAGYKGCLCRVMLVDAVHCLVVFCTLKRGMFPLCILIVLVMLLMVSFQFQYSVVGGAVVCTTGGAEVGRIGGASSRALVDVLCRGALPASGGIAFQSLPLLIACWCEVVAGDS